MHTGRGYPSMRPSLLSIRIIVVILIFILLIVISRSAPNPVSWELTWSDEFNGPNGSPVDPRNWSFQTGAGGWGNGELEYYTDRTQNATLQDGSLVIRAMREDYGGSQYTSARLSSQNKFEQAYGRFEARIRLPYGQGIWPAFWMLGGNIDQVNWPNCGEIDIMENFGLDPSTVQGAVHGPGYSGDSSLNMIYSLPGSDMFYQEYHIFAIDWDPQQIKFYVDGNLYYSVSRSSLPAGRAWVFDHPFFLVLNVAVGGDVPGSPDASTVFPQAMVVDYVRVYQRK